MLTPWLGWLRRIAVVIAVMVAALALPWVLAWPWLRSLLAGQWPTWIVIAVAIDAALLLLAAIWWLWWRWPGRQVAGLSLKIRDPKARADVEDNFRKTVGQALGGAIVLIGAGLAYWQFTQQQQTAYQQILTQQKAAEDSRKASQDLLISNQVSKGFEQLAGKETTMRLGGIYALEGVMNTSEQYHQPVLEALCAFVRDSTTRQQVTLTTLLAAPFPAARDETAGKGDGTPATDVQAALTVIGRRNPGPGRVNLAGANIPGADLFQSHLEGAVLAQAHLERTSLRKAHLEGAVLAQAHLERASLNEAHLEGANLWQAHLDGAFLEGAHLERARVLEAHLERAFLEGAYLEGANLADGAHLERAFLEGAHLEGAILVGAHLDGAVLRWAHLEGAELVGAHLEGAVLPGADGLTQAQIDRAYGDAATTLPAGLTRPARWGAPAGGGTAPAR